MLVRLVFLESSLNHYLGKGKAQHRFNLKHEQAENDFDFVDDNLTTTTTLDDVSKTRINNDYKSNRLGWLGQYQVSENQELSWSNTYFKRDKGLAGPANQQSSDVRYKEEHFSSQWAYHINELLGRNSHTHFDINILQNEDRYEDINSNLGLGNQNNHYPIQTRSYGIVHQIQSHLIHHTFNLKI